MTPTQQENLEILATFLETECPDDQFDFARWVGEDWLGAEDLSCGTSACALGWATTIPKLRAQGLRLCRYPTPPRSTCPTTTFPALIKEGIDTYKKYLIVGNWQVTLDACKELFGLDEIWTKKLFTPAEIPKYEHLGRTLQTNAKPKDVAKVIRDYLKDTTRDNEF